MNSTSLYWLYILHTYVRRPVCIDDDKTIFDVLQTSIIIYEGHLAEVRLRDLQYVISVQIAYEFF